MKGFIKKIGEVLIFVIAFFITIYIMISLPDQ
jgi:hypothetical protein